MRQRPEELAAGEWAVLAVLEEGPTHGFEIARLLGPGGEVGRVWSLRRPLVYRTIDVLTALELARVVGTAPSSAGPPRTLVEATELGRRRVEDWLVQPVEHVRDARSLLMLKLLFIDRRRTDPAPLLAAQRTRFETLTRELEAMHRGAEGFARTLALWRLENTRAAARFVDQLLASRLADPDKPKTFPDR